MATITELSARAMRANPRQPPTVWRDQLLPANFDGYAFHVDAASRESGRRIHVHQFPKKELPYSEDMGHEAITFTVRGYIIVYPHEEAGTPGLSPNTLYQRDYRNARETLLQALAQDPANPYVKNNLELLEVSFRKGKAIQ